MLIKQKHLVFTNFKSWSKTVRGKKEVENFESKKTEMICKVKGWLKEFEQKKG